MNVSDSASSPKAENDAPAEPPTEGKRVPVLPAPKAEKGTLQKLANGESGILLGWLRWLEWLE